MDEQRNLVGYHGVNSRYCHLVYWSERVGLFSVKRDGAKPYLPGLNCLLEACLEVPPPLYITRINTTGPECRVRTAYLLLPEFVQFLVTSTNLAEHKVYLPKQVRFCWE